jgi:hypothetical protein
MEDGNKGRMDALQSGSCKGMYLRLRLGGAHLVRLNIRCIVSPLKWLLLLTECRLNACFQAIRDWEPSSTDFETYLRYRVQGSGFRV